MHGKGNKNARLYRVRERVLNVLLLSAQQLSIFLLVSAFFFKWTKTNVSTWALFRYSFWVGKNRHEKKETKQQKHKIFVRNQQEYHSKRKLAAYLLRRSCCCRCRCFIFMFVICTETALPSSVFFFHRPMGNHSRWTHWYFVLCHTGSYSSRITHTHTHISAPFLYCEFPAPLIFFISLHFHLIFVFSTIRKYLLWMQNSAENSLNVITYTCMVLRYCIRWNTHSPQTSHHLRAVIQYFDLHRQIPLFFSLYYFSGVDMKDQWDMTWRQHFEM